ncbi:MAG: hypothetical protein IJZ09_05710 [Tidjanibacter sp.]|nr:hypothetical protein [Tidjanibacter sp.]
MRTIHHNFHSLLSLLALLMMASCGTPEVPEEPKEFEEPIPPKVFFTNASFSYMGDDVGEQTSDGWVVKFLTDMEIDDYGNPIGEGAVMQLLLNVTYNPSQEADTSLLPGIYTAQTSSGDFRENSFVDGYMDFIELPDGRHERADGSFYADIAEGSTEMDVDLLDDGAIAITRNTDGTFTIEGVMVGKKCRKRYFEWSGNIEPTSYVEPETPNSTLTSNMNLTTLSKMQLQDKGDCFYRMDESYRCLLLFVVEDGITFNQWGKPEGNGKMLRLELLVPWDSSVEDGVPAGRYPFVQRNPDTSIDKDKIVPFRAIAGLPDCFTAPYWSGSWYVEYAEGVWSELYGRIDSGEVVVERGEDGSHHLSCTLYDCSSEPVAIAADVHIASDKVLIYK